MTDTPISTTATTAAPSPSPAPAGTAATSPDLFAKGAPPVANDRSRGHSPSLNAREAREQQVDPQSSPKIRLGDQEFAEQDLRDALGYKAEAELRNANLPQSPDGYALDLPKDFKAPEGVTFEFNKDDPLLAHARALAHQRGIDQDTFSDMLSVYAANKIAEAQQITTARSAELARLGINASARISQIETWLRARVGSDADVLVNQMRSYPHAGFVRALEKIVAGSSNQGGADFSQSHRNNDQPQGRIAGYEDMSFAQRRIAQMSRNPAAPRGGRES